MIDTAKLTAGTTYIVTLTDGTSLTGDFISVNSKGLNIKVDGKVVSRSLTRIEAVNLPIQECGDDYTTAALAVIFETSAKALRVELRRLGLGVGKGRKYHFTQDQVADLKTQLAQARQRARES